MILVSCPLPGKTFFTEFECLDNTSGAMEFFLATSLSYFVADAVGLRYCFGPEEKIALTVIHHCICITGVLSALFIGRAVGVVIQCVFITEVSTLFVNNCFFIDELGLTKTKKWAPWYKCNGILVLITFFMWRVCFLGFILIRYIIPTLINYDYEEAFQNIGWAKMQFEKVLLVIFILLWGLNIFWFYKLVSQALKMTKQPDEGQSE